MAKKEKSTSKKTVKPVIVEEKKIEEIIELSETTVETKVDEDAKEGTEEVLDIKEINEDIDNNVKENSAIKNEEVEQVVEEVPIVEEKPNKKSCNCKRQLTTKDVFGYMWMGQNYGE